MIKRIGYFFTALFLVAWIEGEAQQAAQSLFESDEVLDITLHGNVTDVLNDRKGTPKDHSLTLAYLNEAGQEIFMPVNVKTRGHFRRESNTCSYPPLSIQFAPDGPHKESIFRDQRKLKLVMPCVEDEYVIREYLVYRIYNQITPASFQARIVKVHLDDEQAKKPRESFYGILLEEENQLAQRVNCITIEAKLKPQQIQQDAFLTMSVFQYMIGNTDWSIQYLQNIKLLAMDASSLPIAVPYDFDHAGIVDAPYARPAEELQMRSAKERRYRGYCIPDTKTFEPVLSKYISLKDVIYRVYTDNMLIDDKTRKNTIAFLDEFYVTINDSKRWQKAFSYPCDKTGTGNVVIKGLKDK